ncbi:fungal hydrophobin-domain-containing protein [Crepidotus variabilis]|uniref:Hydrophobin n=1 Tax=Crepidotus variabilis TaxID=179855 RepID=A0A9P6E883_9AGAR|nr:fungal hydrophobin-domain-containing protein [Crepidotus variabilis]
MQFRLLSTSLLAIVSLAAATGTTTVTVTVPPPGQTPTPASQCNTGALWCCNNVQSANSGGVVGILLGLLDLVVAPVTAQVGSSCSPLSVIGLSGNSCSAQPVCCQNNNFSGLVVIGCSPVNLNL